MKYADLMATLRFVETEMASSIEKIELIHSDFKLIFLELSKKINNTDVILKTDYIMLNGIGIDSVDEDSILLSGTKRGRFFPPKDEYPNQLKVKNSVTIFTTVEILSDEERIIKKLLE